MGTHENTPFILIFLVSFPPSLPLSALMWQILFKRSAGKEHARLLEVSLQYSELKQYPAGANHDSTFHISIICEGFT